MAKAIKIKELIEAKQITISYLEKKLGYSNASLKKAIARNSTLKDEVLDKIANLFPDVSRDWLYYDKGDIFGRSENKDEDSLNPSLLKEFLAEKDKQIELFKKYIEEKDARRQDSERYVKEAQAEKERLYNIIDKLQSSIEQQLTSLNLAAQSILLTQRAEHEVMMESFDRLEKKKPGTLLKAAGTREFELRETLAKASKLREAGK